ncbi:MAG: hypothetical protein QOJ03_3219, partial [Frankiaceae bacterium]|nr:hypothetical protein [Frankiaceae bacterium]
DSGADGSLSGGFSTASVAVYAVTAGDWAGVGADSATLTAFATCRG